MTLPALQNYSSYFYNHTPWIVKAGMTNLAMAIDDSAIGHIIRQEAKNPMTHTLMVLGLTASLQLGRGRVKHLATISALTAGMVLANNKEQLVIFLTTVIFSKICQHYIACFIRDRKTLFNSSNIIHLADYAHKKN